MDDRSTEMEKMAQELMARQGVRRNSPGGLGALPTAISTGNPARATCLPNERAPSECKNGDQAPDVPDVKTDPAACVSDQIEAANELGRMALGYPKGDKPRRRRNDAPSAAAQRGVMNAGPRANLMAGSLMIYRPYYSEENLYMIDITWRQNKLITN